ncbi:acyl-CoA N-acyltransferase [Boletus edulis BED1]|uniref:Acyl-CoA N-acyltransferase n=1 Tax=Boletus edulis BED1 TaxID=1328754 RepID=A0AAD4BVY1_BOLED|nr:acyl-CoA N-acyltransferase [Boletus edulis BED1]
MFTTDRLFLRGFEDGDADKLIALHNDAKVQRFITNEPIVPRPAKYKEDLKKWAEACTLYLTLILRETGEFVGQCSITVQEPKNRDGFFGIALHPKFWGKGYGTEASKFVVGYAFEALGVQRVSLGVFEGNKVAILLYKRLGFKEEGRKRRCNWVEGHWEDMIHMGILDDEWAAMHRDEDRLLQSSLAAM